MKRWLAAGGCLISVLCSERLFELDAREPNDDSCAFNPIAFQGQTRPLISLLISFQDRKNG